MKNIILVSFLMVFSSVCLISCSKKKDDPQPVAQIATTNNNAMDTTLLKNKTWVRIDTLYADRYDITKFVFNTNGTYLRTDINIIPNYPSDTTTETGNYYLKFTNGILEYDYKVSGYPSYSPLHITKLTATEFWFDISDKYYVQ